MTPGEGEGLEHRRRMGGGLMGKEKRVKQDLADRAASDDFFGRKIGGKLGTARRRGYFCR